MFVVRRIEIRRPAARDLAGLALVVAVAAYTRLSFLNLVMFVDDETWASQMARSVVEGRSLPLIGLQSSVGVNNPPTFVWLMTIPYTFTRDPEVATGFIGLLGVLAVVGCYVLTRTYFGAIAALVASLLFAAHPWAAIYARKIWASDVMPLFAILFVGSLLAYLEGGRAWRLALALLWVAVAIEIHFSGVVLLPVVAVAFLAYRSRFRWRHLLAGCLVVLATAAPYVLWQVQHGWPDVPAAAAVAGRPARIDLDAAWGVLRMVSTPGYVYLDGSAPFEWVYAAEGALVVGGLVYALARLGGRAKSAEERRGLLILVGWTLAALLVFTRHSTEVYRHYLTVVYPAQFMLVGVLVAGFRRATFDRRASGRSARVARHLSWIVAGGMSALLLVIAAPQLYAFTAYHRLQWNGQADQRLVIADVYNRGVPVAYERMIAREIATLDAYHPDQAIYLQAPDLQKTDALRFLANLNLKFKPLGSSASSVLVFPASEASDAVFVTANVETRSTRLLRSLDATSLVDTMRYPASDLDLAFLRLGPDLRGRVLEQLRLKPLPYALDNGVRLLGYDLPRLAPPGGAVPLVVSWEVGPGRETARQGYQFYAHLADAKAHAWGGVDALDYGSAQWGQGETVICWYDVPVDPNAPPGLYHLLIGMYDHDGTRPVPVVGPDGRSAGNDLSLGPLKVTPGSRLPTAGEAIVQHRQAARLGEEVGFLGYDLPRSVVSAGDALPVTLHWVAGVVRADYTVFVHVVDPAGRLVAQVDSPPLGGAYPTSAWDQDEYVRDAYQVTLPKDLPAGTYRLEVGMYRLQTGRRLPVTSESGQSLGDSIDLDSPIAVR